MTITPGVISSKSSLGDSAVDGLLAGTMAGLLMAVYVAVVGLLSGQSLTAILAQFDPSPAPSAVTGALAHLAVSGVYGMGFALAWRWLRRLWPRIPGALLGLAYGLLVWCLAVLLLRLPAAATPEGWLAAVPPLHLAVAHLLYGLALGVLLARRGQSA